MAVRGRRVSESKSRSNQPQQRNGTRAARATAPQPAKPAAPKPAAPKPPAAGQPAPQQQAPQAPQQGANDQPQLMYSPWTRICEKSAETNNKQICIIGKDGRLETGQPIVVAQIIEPEGAPRKLRVIVPIPVMVQNGTRILIDDQELAQAPYAVCSPQMGCAAEYNCDDATIARLKKGKNVTVQVINVYNTIVSLPLPLADFAKAFDGPPIDPKALETQQRQLQSELQKRADEARKKLEAQQPPAAGGAAPAAPK